MRVGGEKERERERGRERERDREREREIEREGGGEDWSVLVWLALWPQPQAKSVAQEIRVTLYTPHYSISRLTPC